MSKPNRPCVLTSKERETNVVIIKAVFQRNLTDTVGRGYFSSLSLSHRNVPLGRGRAGGWGSTQTVGTAEEGSQVPKARKSDTA